MKKILVAVAVASLTASASYAAFTAKTANTPAAGVINSVHDMRGYAGTGTDVTVAGIDQNRVCAFCHTPHHAYDPAASGLDYSPLWAHEVNTANFTPYQSTTINSTLFSAADNLIGPSRLCMSCHDGTIAVDTHYDTVATTKLQQNDAFNSPTVGFGSAGGGHDLANDHPIGFDYVAVAKGVDGNTPGSSTIATEDNWIVAPGTGAGALQYKNNTNNLTVRERLYVPSTAIGDVGIMTCATCHDVHNRKNMDNNGLNYLVLAPQADSALCLTCHIK